MVGGQRRAGCHCSSIGRSLDLPNRSCWQRSWRSRWPVAETEADRELESGPTWGRRACTERGATTGACTVRVYFGRWRQCGNMLQSGSGILQPNLRQHKTGLQNESHLQWLRLDRCKLDIISDDVYVVMVNYLLFMMAIFSHRKIFNF
jgi:hypothetical protein